MEFFVSVAGVLALFGFRPELIAADFTVTTPGSYFLINSKVNPTLGLVRGRTYTFAVSTAINHPFEILSPGVSNNSITQGTITYTVPTNVANYGYICPIHDFGGSITTAPPPVLPVVRIVGFTVSTNLTIKSTGTSTWSVLPQFSTNLGTTNWYSLTVQTNRYANGTNETICGRPPGNPVFIRVNGQLK